MAKGNILEDAFEQLAELGSSTAKKSVQQVVQTLNPLASPTQTEGRRTEAVKDSLTDGGGTESVKKGKNHTPVDFDKLKNKFQDKDKLQAEALKNRFFQRVKNEDEKTLQRQEMEKAQKKKQEEYSVQNKIREDQEKKQREQQGNIPQGKTRRSIFSPKKTAERQHAEVKPASGKQ